MSSIQIFYIEQNANCICHRLSCLYGIECKCHQPVIHVSRPQAICDVKTSKPAVGNYWTGHVAENHLLMLKPTCISYENRLFNGNIVKSLPSLNGTTCLKPFSHHYASCGAKYMRSDKRLATHYHLSNCLASLYRIGSTGMDGKWDRVSVW